MWNVSRTGELWRGELAMQAEGYLTGTLSLDALLDWALDYPFFDDRSLLDQQEQRLVAHMLGCILQLSPQEPEESRTARDQLVEAVEILWNRRPLPERPG